MTHYIKTEYLEVKVFEKIVNILKHCEEPVELHIVCHKNGLFEAILDRDFNCLSSDATDITSLNRELEKIFKKIK